MPGLISGRARLSAGYHNSISGDRGRLTRGHARAYSYYPFLTVMVLMFPVALFWSALVAFVSTISRSQQQAQTYLDLLFMTVVLTALASFLFTIANLPWLGIMPIIGQLTLSVDLLGGGHPAAYRYLVTAAGSVLRHWHSSQLRHAFCGASRSCSEAKTPFNLEKSALSE